MTQWFKQDGDVIIFLGSTREDLGGTEYLKVLHHREQGSPPLLSLETEKAVQTARLNLFARGSCSRPTIAPMADWLSPWPNVVSLARDERLGAVVQLSPRWSSSRCPLLFGESQSRVVLSVKPEHVEAVARALQVMLVFLRMIGTVRR